MKGLAIGAHPDDIELGFGASLLAHAARVLTYEAPWSRGFVPQMFLDVEGLVEQKLELIRAHESQVLKNRLVDLEAVAAQARYRGFQGRVHYAEAFEIERFVWDLSAGAIAAPAVEIVFEGVR